MAETATDEGAAVPNDGPQNRRSRKEEGRRLKRQRIEEFGGVRPRRNDKAPEKQDKGAHSAKGKGKDKYNQQPPHNKKKEKLETKTQYRFGQVMDRVPCRNKPRFSTLTIALPGSVLSNCQTRELKTQLVGQIARACTIYHVDEIVVFDDNLSKKSGSHDHGRRNDSGKDEIHGADMVDRSCSFLARVLQYCECPQYLRRHFFPRHPDLQFAGLLPPIDAPHHVRMDDRSKYREGVVIEEKGKEGTSSLVNCGLRNRPIEIDRSLPIGIRCTVEVDTKDYGRPGKKMPGKVVPPAAPREDDGTYWGYQTRIADSINKVFEECPFEGAYDLKIGTSERGSVNIDDKEFSMPQFRHSLIVFGGVAGIEECVDADETSTLPGSESKKLFDLWVNVCPFQGSRTIRTEEAVLISLAKFSPLLASNFESHTSTETKAKKQNSSEPSAVDFSDGVSEESSDSSDSEG